MDITTALLLIALVSLVLWLALSYLQTRDLPPGPMPLPFLGNALSVGSKPYETFHQMAALYGPVFRLFFGSNLVVVLNDWKSIHEAFAKTGNIFTNKPTGTLFRKLRNNLGILASEGSLWNEHRRFALKALRDLGLGKRTAEDIVDYETQELIKVVKSYGGTPVDFKIDLNTWTLNIILGITAGTHFDWNDPFLKHITTASSQSFELLNPAGLANRLPWLRFFGVGNEKVLKANRGQKDKFLDKEIQEHQRHLGTDDEKNDLISIYLRERQDQLNKEHNTTFTHDQIRAVMSDLFSAGMETTVTTSLWMFLLLAKYPDLQKTVQHEIDRVIGKDRAPGFQDHTQMPYTMAFLYEVQRFRTVVPLVVHSNSAEVQLSGFRIPKGTTIFANLWSAHHDPNTWKDPDTFDPSRFLDQGKLIKTEALIPFSTGKRSCLGESLARTELFLLITNFLQKFNISAPEGESLGLDTVMGLTIPPEPFKIIAKQR